MTFARFGAWAEDICFVAGLSLVGIGVYTVCPAGSLWFYSGGCLIGYGVLIALGARGKA